MRLGGIVVATCLAAAAAAGEGEYTISSKDKAFNDWFHEITKEFGTDANAVEIRTTTDMGRGVYALDTISEETPLLKIPRDYIVSVDTVESSASAMVYERIERSSDKLALFILEQKAKGDSSKFKPWIDVMPREFGSPLFGTPQELERLKGDPIHQEVLQELKAWEQQYDLLSASILEKFPEVFPSGCCSFEEYKWARHMIESRAWHLRGRQYLAPMADFFNHQTLPSMTYDTEPDERGAAFLAHHHVTPNYVEVLADREHTKEEQVFECYGDNSNSIYFKYHGFVPDENQYDCQDLTMPALVPESEDPYYQYRIQYLGQLGFRSPHVCLRNRDDHFLKAVNFIRVRSMTRDDFQECASQDYQSIPLSERLAKCILVPTSMSPLIASVQARLDAYPTSSAEDAKALATEDLTAIERWSVMYVSKRKAIMEALIDYAKASDASSSSTGSSGKKKKKRKPKSSEKSEL